MKKLVVSFKNGQTIELESEVEFVIGDHMLTAMICDKIGTEQGDNSREVTENIFSVRTTEK